MNLTNIESKILDLEKETSSVKGRLSLLEDQFMESENTISELKELSIINKKAIEVLNVIQKSTKELICNIFETVVTNALQYVYDDDGYEFKLELLRHGNRSKLTFLLKTPDMQEAHDIMTTRAGGEKDLITLALRFVLLECSKNQGFLFGDEVFKRLDSSETINRAINFIKETQKDTDRQIILITHKQEIVDSIDNPILFTKN